LFSFLFLPLIFIQNNLFENKKGRLPGDFLFALSV